MRGIDTTHKQCIEHKKDVCEYSTFEDTANQSINDNEKPLQKELDSTEFIPSNQETEELISELREEQCQALLRLQQNALLLVQEQKQEDKEVEFLRRVPFVSTRLSELPLSLGEMLIRFFTELTVEQLSLIRNPFVSSEFQHDLVHWSREYLKCLSMILQLEDQFSLKILVEAIHRFNEEHSSAVMKLQTSSQSSRSQDSKKLVEPWFQKMDSKELEPGKQRFMQECHDYLSQEISKIFVETPKRRGEDIKESICGLPDEKTEDLILAQDDYFDQALLVSKPAQEKEHHEELQQLKKKATNPSATETTEIPYYHIVILRDLLLLLILSNKFDSRVHELFKRLTASLKVQTQAVITVAQDHIVTDLRGSMKKDRKESKYAKAIRAAKVAGFAVGLGKWFILSSSNDKTDILGAVAGLTAGLAAPAIAAGIGALGISTVTGASSSAIAVAFGGGTAGLSGWKYSKLIGRLKVFQFDKIEDPRTAEKKNLVRTPSVDINEATTSTASTPSTVRISNFTVIICVSGWLQSLDDLHNPWKNLATSKMADVYSLRWDPDVLLELGTSITTLLSQTFAVAAAHLWLQHTAAGALSLALMWPAALIQYAASLDNSWAVCKERAIQAGKLLAEALCNEATMGSRPVILLGYSMGARAIHYCLRELHKNKQFHRVSDVILLGIPTSCNQKDWQQSREVVSGRLINVYSRSDWVLGFMFRYMEWGLTVAGISPVNVEGIENIDVTGLISNHAQYSQRVEDILTYIGVDIMPKSTLLGTRVTKSNEDVEKINN